MRRDLRALIFVFLVMLTSYLFASRALALGLSAKGSAVLEAESGRLLYSQGGSEKLPIASTTKIMTALLVIENCDLGERIKIPAEAAGVEGSSMYLQAGEELSVRELLYGLLLQSGNDAAVALAIHCSGSVEDFVALMNERAAELGLTSTSFRNPNGLDEDGHYSTAAELGKIAAEAMKNEVFRETVAMKTASFGRWSLKNHNKLLWRCEGAVGVKTGFTKSSGRTLVGAAERDGVTLISVTLNAPDDWNDHEKLLNHGFSLIEGAYSVEKGAALGTLPVFSGEKREVSFVAAEDFYYPLLGGEKALEVMLVPNFLYAPVRAGQEAGSLSIMVGGEKVGEVGLVCAEDIAERIDEDKSFWEILKELDLFHSG